MALSVAVNNWEPPINWAVNTFQCINITYYDKLDTQGKSICANMERPLGHTQDDYVLSAPTQTSRKSIAGYTPNQQAFSLGAG